MPGRPRKPTNVLALQGAFKHNPARGLERANEPKPDDEIGDVPETLAPDAASCWHEIVGLAHRGTLSRNDRLIVEHGAQLLAELRRENWKVNPALMIRWEGVLAKLGMTPADRSRVSVRKQASDANPLDEFAQANGPR